MIACTELSFAGASFLSTSPILRACKQQHKHVRRQSNSAPPPIEAIAMALDVPHLKDFFREGIPGRCG
jgi:hypothetical protein